MTNDMKGFVETDKASIKLNFAKTGAQTTGKIKGKWRGIMNNTTDSGTKKNHPITLKDVIYVPDIQTNLFSITKAMEQGGKIISEGKDCLTIILGTQKIRFDHKLKTRLGFMLGAFIKPTTSQTTLGDIKVDINDFHLMLCHANEEVTRRTAEKLGYKLTGKMEICEFCAKGKLQQTPINRIIMNDETL